MAFEVLWHFKKKKSKVGKDTYSIMLDKTIIIQAGTWINAFPKENGVTIMCDMDRVTHEMKEDEMNEEDVPF